MLKTKCLKIVKIRLERDKLQLSICQLGTVRHRHRQSKKLVNAISLHFSDIDFTESFLIELFFFRFTCRTCT